MAANVNGRRFKLLSVERDYKTSKGSEYGVLTGVLYLASAKQSGYNVCPHATPGCTAACLFTAGRGAMTNVKNARIKKTKLFFEQRDKFWSMLIADLAELVMVAESVDMKPAVRLNGTSDLPWERMPVTVGGKRIADNIMSIFPGVQFYDYTKWPNRYGHGVKNYDLTFSVAETRANEKHAREWLSIGGKVAMVFGVKKGDKLPSEYWGYPVVDGDLNDIRFRDKPGTIIGLRAKGKARKDTSGFVRGVPITQLDILTQQPTIAATRPHRVTQPTY